MLFRARGHHYPDFNTLPAQPLAPRPSLRAGCQVGKGECTLNDSPLDCRERVCVVVAHGIISQRIVRICAAWRSVLQRVAAIYSVLQCVAGISKDPGDEGTGTWPDYLVNRDDQKNEGPVGEKNRTKIEK